MSDDAGLTELLSQACADDGAAMSELLRRYRGKIRNVIAIRMDRRMKPRVDPSDIVQETFVEAVNRLPDYLKSRPIAFFPWLRSIALDRLVEHHRRHVGAQRRSVLREACSTPQAVTDESELRLARHFVSAGSSPSRGLEKRELCLRVREALRQLEADERDVLVLRYLEQLTAVEIAAILGVGLRTVWRRHTRAIERMGHVLEGEV